MSKRRRRRGILVVYPRRPKFQRGGGHGSITRHRDRLRDVHAPRVYLGCASGGQYLHGCKPRQSCLKPSSAQPCIRTKDPMCPTPAAINSSAYSQPSSPSDGNESTRVALFSTGCPRAQCSTCIQSPRWSTVMPALLGHVLNLTLRSQDPTPQKMQGKALSMSCTCICCADAVCFLQKRWRSDAVDIGTSPVGLATAGH